MTTPTGSGQGTSLPSNPSLINLKMQAKSLLKAHRKGDPSCCDVLRNLKELRDKPDAEVLGTKLSLTGVQHALAREYGFETWAAMKLSVLGKAGKADIRHILCGDSCGGSLRDSTVPGDVFVWPEVYIKGPAPGNVTYEEFSLIRANVLATCFHKQATAEELRERAAQRYPRLDLSRDYSEVVLWYDACLFDQTHLIHQLDYLPTVLTESTKLSLICIGEFPGFKRFVGLGQLSPDQMASLFETRHDVTSAEIALAQKAWRAFRSNDPRDLEAVVEGDCSALPYLKDALIRFLEEYPSTRSGLSRLQHEILEAVASGAAELGPIFAKVSDAEEQAFFGDTMLWEEIDFLATSVVPALRVEGPQALTSISKVDSEPLPEGGLKKWRVGLTTFGEALLAGKKDFVEANGIDRWYGGVHLQSAAARGEARWRWDAETRQLRENYTDLHIASLSGNSEAVRETLKRGASATEVDKDGLGAIHHASMFGDAEPVQSLIDAGCDVNAVNHDGATPLHAAAWYGNAAAIAVLIANDANVNAQYSGLDRQSVLFNAAMSGNAEAVGLLLNAGADVSAVTAKGETPLHAAVHKWPVPSEAEEKIRKMVQFIYEQGHDASDAAANRVVDLLLSHGCDANARDYNGMTPLQLAELSGREKTVAHLCERGTGEGSGGL